MSGAATSLVPKGESVPDRCPTTPYDLVCVERPDLRVPASCDRWACPFCGPREASRRARVLAWARPERFVTLTQAPEDWQRLRAKLRKLTMRVRQEGLTVEWAWTVERGTQTGMIHIHALQHGQFIPQAKLQDWWGAIVHIERIRQPKGATRYALKEANRVAGYTLKGSHQAMLAHLDLNGGRVCHYSRGYLHGKRVREVEKLLWPGQPDLTWVAVSNGSYDHEVAELRRHVSTNPTGMVD